MNIKAFVTPQSWVDFIRSFILLAILIIAGVVGAGNYQWVQITDHNIFDAEINTKIEVAAAQQTKALAIVVNTNAMALKSAENNLQQLILRNEINALANQITFLIIKVRENEATKSEKIILPVLEQKLVEMKAGLD